VEYFATLRATSARGIIALPFARTDCLISSHALASRSVIRVRQAGPAAKDGLDIVTVGIQYKRRVVLRMEKVEK